MKKGKSVNWRSRVLAVWLLVLPAIFALGGCKSIPGFSGAISDSESELAEYDAGDYDAQVQWLDSYTEALQLARESGKPVLVNFTGSDWCRYCIQLVDEVFLTPEFESWAAANVILLELDYPRRTTLGPELRSQNQQLAQQFGVSRYPTILFLDGEGNPLGSPMGYQRGGPTRWIAEANSRMR